MVQAIKMRPTPTQAAGRAVAWSGCSGGTHRILHRANKAARGAFLAQRAMKTLIKVKINQATFKLTPPPCWSPIQLWQYAGFGNV